MTTEVQVKPRRRIARQPLPNTPDPVEIAMVAVASGKPLPDIARRVLEEQTELIRAQAREIRLKHAVERLRIAFWAALALLGAAIVILLGTLVWRASTSDALVVEPFRVPPALSQAGLSGEVMATRVMDQIALMQSRTLSTRPASSYSTDWGDDIRVALPNTSATLGDLRRLLRSWLGRETRISGEAVREGGSWTVTTRVSGQTAISARGPELEPLVANVAEGIFQQTQPFRYIVYLSGAGRREEALAVARELALSGPGAERPWGVVAYANVLGYPEQGDVERLGPLRKAAEAVPDFPMPLANYAQGLATLGRSEEALVVHERSYDLLGDGSKISEEFRGQFLARGRADSDQLTGAFSQAAEAYERAGRTGTPIYATQYIFSAVAARYQAHDVQAAANNYAWLIDLTGFNAASTLETVGNDDDGKLLLAFKIYNEFAHAKAIGDDPALRRTLPGQVVNLQAILNSLDAKQARDLGRFVWPSIAPDLARTGRVAEAQALLAPLPLHCYPCVVARGEVAAAQGDLAAARRWFARAKAMGPSLPFADEALGRMLLTVGNAEAAEASFEQAHRIEPRFADASKGAGDALMRKGEFGRAAKRFGQAAEHAPAWGALYLAWGEALRGDGDQDDAQAKLQAASRMVLNLSDRKKLAALR